MSVKDDILAEAHRLGFLLAGIAKPTTPAHYSSYLEWIAHGLHAEMAYLANDRNKMLRGRPNLILPEARSILCLAIPYPSGLNVSPPAKDEPRGKVAAYAWGKDYHLSLPHRLNTLVKNIQKQIGRTIIWKGYTDTGPILERDLAVQAGLGWIGRNTCLISPPIGSFTFLAEIFWDIELEAETTNSVDLCGRCRRCVDACPTGCILPNRTLDSQKCISYLTIENKSSIPLGIRQKMGNWIFGCDVCQQVCPWNRTFSASEGDPAFKPLHSNPSPILIEEISLTPQTFNTKYKDSPIRRARRSGYLRNVAVALGNIADPGTIPSLRSVLLLEAEPIIRAHAAWALGEFKSSPARSALDQALKSEPDPQVAAEIRLALAK